MEVPLTWILANDQQGLQKTNISLIWDLKDFPDELMVSYCSFKLY